MRISDWSSDVCSSDLQADTVFRKAADRELATRRTISVVVGEDDTGDEVDRVEDRLAGILARDDFLTEHRLRLRRVGRLDAADIGSARSGDADVVFEIDRTGRLREGRRREQCNGKRRGACCENMAEFHEWVSPFGGLTESGRAHVGTPVP